MMTMMVIMMMMHNDDDNNDADDDDYDDDDQNHRCHDLDICSTEYSSICIMKPFLNRKPEVLSQIALLSYFSLLVMDWRWLP